MGLLEKFYKKKKLLEELNQVLENDIFKILAKAELLLESDPELGVQLCDTANGLYRWRGYDFKVECRMNDVFLFYMKNYSVKR